MRPVRNTTGTRCFTYKCLHVRNVTGTKCHRALSMSLQIFVGKAIAGKTALCQLSSPAWEIDPRNSQFLRTIIVARTKFAWVKPGASIDVAEGRIPRKKGVTGSRGSANWLQRLHSQQYSARCPKSSLQLFV